MCPLLSSPRPSFSTTHTPARRITRMARGGGGVVGAHGFSSYSISFLSLLACFAVAKGGKRGWVWGSSARSVCRGFTTTSNHLQNSQTSLPYSSYEWQNDPMRNEIQSVCHLKVSDVFISSACLQLSCLEDLISCSAFLNIWGPQGHYLESQSHLDCQYIICILWFTQPANEYQPQPD